MLSRTSILFFCVGFTAGVIAFGCATVRRESSQTPRAQTEPSAVQPPIPDPAVRPASWVGADAPPPDPTPASGQLPPNPPPLPDSPAPTSNAPSQTPVPAASTPGLPSSNDATAPLTERPASPEASAGKVRELHRQAADRYAGIDSYIARLRRREVVGGQPKAEEILLLKFRKQPWSVYFKWLGPEHNGREAVFVNGQHDSKLHTLLAAGDMPFMPAGKCIALDPESSLVRSRSRHAVTETGIGHIIAQMGKQLQAEDEHQKVIPLRYVGQVRRPEYVAPLDVVEQTIPPDGEAGPDGGTRQVFFDPATHLPVLLVLRDSKGHELEYYCYDRLQYPVRLDDDDFDPRKLWKQPTDASEKPR